MAKGNQRVSQPPEGFFFWVSGEEEKRGFCTSKTVIQIALTQSLASVLPNQNPHPRVISLRFLLVESPRGEL